VMFGTGVVMCVETVLEQSSPFDRKMMFRIRVITSAGNKSESRSSLVIGHSRQDVLL
jgi:hypothetical protein